VFLFNLIKIVRVENYQDFYKSAFQVGAVVAVSLVHDRANVSCATFKKIAMAWFVTLPVSGVISALSYYLICLWAL
jgi:phosphate/sulfate permease